jgi:hypothetical protein
MHVAIIGLGPSCRQFLELSKRWGGRRAVCDEVWSINALGDVFISDLIFHMDDVRVQEIRAQAKPQSNIAKMLKWMKTCKTPIVTSRSSQNYPALVEFPLQDVVNMVPTAYFNSTAAYAVAYAIYKGATKISCWGMDFTYPDVHDAEKGRACVEFWLGVAVSRGIELAMPKTTSLMDAYNSQDERFYGYDCVNLGFSASESGEIMVEITEKDSSEYPSADQVEKNYDHTRHTNKMMERAPESAAHHSAPEVK